ncbi:hypothetical protein BDD12DRAFT_14606, partial [Trichophaea hybrida]
MSTTATPTPPPQNLVVSLSALTKSVSCHDLGKGLEPSNWRRVYLDALDIHLVPDNTTTTTTTTTTVDVVQAFPTADSQSVAALFLRSLSDPYAFSYNEYCASKRTPTQALNSTTGHYLYELACTNRPYYATHILCLLAAIVRVDKPWNCVDVTNNRRSARDPDSALRLSFRGASTTIYPRCLLQLQKAAPLMAVVEVKSYDRYRDVTAAACAYLLAVAQRYLEAFPTASIASPVVVIEHTRCVNPDMSAYMQTNMLTFDTPYFVSYTLYRAEIPRAFVDQPGSSKILVSVSRRYSTEVEEDRVALGTALVETVLRTVTKA